MKYSNQFLYKLEQKDKYIYKKLYMDMYAKMCSFANKYLEDEDASRDIVHDIFMKLWEEKIVVRSGNALESFLYVSVKNSCLNYLRKIKIKNDKDNTVREYYMNLSSESMYEYTILEKDVYKKLHDYVQDLPKKSKRVMELYLEGLTNDEIKDYLGVSISTVKSLKNISFRKIRNRVKNIT